MDAQIINPKFCGDCPYATKTQISQVFLNCTLWGGQVKSEDPACQFVLAKDKAQSIMKPGRQT